MSRFTHALIALSLILPLQGQSIDEIYSRHIKALGGEKAIAAIKSMRKVTKVSMRAGLGITVITECKAPKCFRSDTTMQNGAVITNVINGKTGWIQNPMTGSLDPDPLPESFVATMIQSIFEWEGPLYQYKNKGIKIAFLGKEILNGTESLKLKLTYTDASESYCWLDAQSYMEIKHIRQAIGGESKSCTSINLFSDYKPINGIMLAHKHINSLEGSKVTQTSVIEKVDFNCVIPNSRFEMPKQTTLNPVAKPGSK